MEPYYSYIIIGLLVFIILNIVYTACLVSQLTKQGGKLVDQEDKLKELKIKEEKIESLETSILILQSSFVTSYLKLTSKPVTFNAYTKDDIRPLIEYYLTTPNIADIIKGATVKETLDFLEELTELTCLTLNQKMLGNYSPTKATTEHRAFGRNWDISRLADYYRDIHNKIHVRGKS